MDSTGLSGTERNLYNDAAAFLRRAIFAGDRILVDPYPLGTDVHLRSVRAPSPVPDHRPPRPSPGGMDASRRLGQVRRVRRVEREGSASTCEHDEAKGLRAGSVTPFGVARSPSRSRCMITGTAVDQVIIGKAAGPCPTTLASISVRDAEPAPGSERGRHQFGEDHRSTRSSLP